jgi:hypothetical protein
MAGFTENHFAVSQLQTEGCEMSLLYEALKKIIFYDPQLKKGI